MSFLAELRRRNVIRMAGLYLVGAWLIVQVASTVLPLFAVAAWVARAVVIVLALGFVPALVFSWVFELTPQGLKRDDDVPLEHSIAPQTARRMDRLIIVILLLALTYFAFDRLVLAPRRDATLIATTTREVKAEGALHETLVANQKSIAVLPFVDMSEGKNQEYFSDGITEEILNALTRIENLKVAGRTSSFYFKGRNENLRTIGKTLGVAHVLEGSVRRQGDRVRITAQLVKTVDGYHLWSETFDRTLSDVFAIQDEISAAIAAALSSRIMGNARPVADATVDPKAYDHYLRARQLLATRGDGDIAKAAELFDAASIIDDDFDAAFSGRARALSLLWTYVGTTENDDSLALARRAAERALSINPANAEAHSTLANLHMLNLWNWADAERETLLAIEYGPNDAEVANFAGDVFRFLGDFDNALKWERRAIDLDPIRAFNHSDLGWVLLAQRRCREAIAPFERAAELDARYWFALDGLARTYLCLDEPANALAAVARLERVHRGSHSLLDGKTRLAIRTGRARDARNLLEELQQRANNGAVVHYWIAQLHAQLGEHDAAATALQRALESRDPTFPADELFYLPEDWPDHPAIRAALDKPELNALFEIRRRHFANTPRASVP